MMESEGERMDGFPPSYRIHHEDCSRLAELETETVFDLVYLEPPVDCDFRATLLPRLEQVMSRLNELGFLLVHVESRRATEAKDVLDALGFPFKGDVIWTYRQRAVRTKALQNQHDTILVYSANPFYYPKRMLIAQSVVGPSSGERTGYPGQKPLDLLKRIIMRLDEYHRIQCVLDPFMGSGTTLVAALELGKSAVGFDNSALACRIADKRLDQSIPASRQMHLELE